MAQPVADIDAAVEAAVSRGLIQPAKTVDDHAMGVFYDLDAFVGGLHELRAAFNGPQWLHACAVKTNPLAAMLRLARERGHGAESTVAKSELRLPHRKLDRLAWIHPEVDAETRGNQEVNL